MKSEKTVLKGKLWNEYLVNNEFKKLGQMELYRCTHRYTPIYKIGDYYFSFKFARGYKSLAALKRLV